MSRACVLLQKLNIHVILGIPPLHLPCSSPTSVLLQLGSNTPLFTAITVGSMFGVDVVIDTTGGTPTMNAVYLATAGASWADYCVILR